MKEKDDDNQSKNQSGKKKITIPRRTPSVVIPERKPVYITADKTTCLHCGCFPKEDPYMKPKKLKPCQKSPLTLYEIAAKAVDGLPLPPPFGWSVWEVADWISDEVGLPQYSECIVMNEIDGLRLLMLEDPSRLPAMNVHDFQDMLTITSSVRQIYATDWIKFSRSIGLPPRKPLTHCTWFKSRTGPSCGIRVNWTRYRTPDFPKVKFARVGGVRSHERIPHFDLQKEICNEYLVPRKFRILPHLSESKQVIWMEIQKQEETDRDEKRVKIVKRRVYETNLMPKKIDLTGLKGKELILARRKMPKAKFFR